MRYRYLDDHWWMHRPDLPLQIVGIEALVIEYRKEDEGKDDGSAYVCG